MKSEKPAKQIVKVTPEQQLASGWLLFQKAEQYRAVANQASANFHDPIDTLNKTEEWAFIHDPVCNLFGHAVELYIKSYLRAKECPKKLEGASLGHNLNALLEEACDYGASLRDETRENIIELNEYFSRPYRLRYPSLGKAQLFFPAGLSDMCDDLRKSLFPSVNERARSLGELRE